MTEMRDDDRIDQYLWDPSAPPAPEVAALEQRLRPLRFDPPRGSIAWLTARPIFRRPTLWYGLAAAAVLLIAAGVSLWSWRLSWPAGRPWAVHSNEASMPAELAVGAPFTIARGARAEIQIARIGQMAVEGDSRLTLLSTQGSRHRLTLDTGSVHVRVWAPPGSVVIRTPTGEVIDLGCEFELTATPDRTEVRVRSGWVQLDNAIDESLIPEGASAAMSAGGPPGVAVFDDASPAFAAAVRSLERGGPDAAAAVSAIAASARARDVYTLLLLIERGHPGSDQFAARAAELVPPPPDVTVNRVLRGDRDALWRWRDTLPLPPPKSWLRNWRDGLPSWLGR